MSGMTEVERLQRADEIVQSALDQEASEQASFIDRACAGDTLLREEVESLLDYRERARDFIEAPAYAFTAELFASVDGFRQMEGRQIGSYRIVREIGRGGMGTVYLAERADGEFKQQVALKVVRHSFVDSELARRFRRERQILASLNHPNIARLLDGGVSADGEPFLVMEHVEGQRIDDYCENKNLSTAGRLRLFLEVCQGVSYAHQHLVVHRDLKPSNILVTTEGTPKLLDFGIAKLLDPEQAGDEHTRTELRAFTPDYASPEQKGGGQITTASDVYSLGVVLSDLLHGAGSSTTGARNSPGRWVSEKNGQKTVATNLRTEQESENKRAGTGMRRFSGAELENIIVMARREDPQRRYASAAQLAEDIQRYLEGQPVRAQKDSVTYRASKFVRRNRVGVAAALLVLLTLVGGIVATLWQARRAMREARVAAQERDRARVEAAKAERINSFLQNILGFTDPSWLAGNPKHKRDATIVDALDEAARRAETELSDHPEVLAAVHYTIGRGYALQSRLDASEAQFRASLDIRRKVLGGEHQDTAQSMGALGNLLIAKGNYAEAESLLGGAVGIYRRARDAGNVDLKWFVVNLSDLSTVQNYLGNPAAAELSLREALELSANFTGQDRAIRAGVYGNLAMVRRAQGDLDAAISFQEKGIEEFRRLSSEPRLEMATPLANLAFYLMMKGEYQRSEALFKEALSIFRKILGETNTFVTYPLINLADNYYMRGDYRQAREEIERAIAIQQKLINEGHVDYGLSYTVLGKVLTRTNDLKGGETYLRRALEARTRALKPGHRWTAETQSALGENLTAQKRFPEAEALLVESYNILNASLGQKDPRTKEALQRLVTLYESWGRLDVASEYRNRI